MKNSSQIAYIRQLCCLGLGREIIMPEVLKAVATVIPSHHNLLTGTDGQGAPLYCLPELYQSTLLEIAAVEWPKFFTPEKNSQVYALLSNQPSITEHHLLDERFFQSDLYRLLWQPCNQHHFILTPVIINRLIVGMLFLFRPRLNHAFSTAEQQLCIQLLPYITHALQEPKRIDTDFVNSGLSSMVIADKYGAIVSLSFSAKKLLALASGTSIYNLDLLKNPTLPPELIKLCRNLNALFKSEDAPPPVLVHINSAGRFIFRAYRMERIDNESQGLVGISIGHQEPMSLKITRNLQFQPLSVAQKQVALLIAQGLSNEKIGQQLCIKSTTVKDHSQKIYQKLDIRNRSELLPKLITDYGDSRYQYH